VERSGGLRFQWRMSQRSGQLRFIVGGTERSWYHGSDAGEPSVRVYPNFKTANYPRSQIPGIENFGAKSHATYQGAKPNPSGKYIHVTMHHVNVNVPLFILFRSSVCSPTKRSSKPSGRWPLRRRGAGWMRIRMLSSRDLRSSFRDVLSDGKHFDWSTSRVLQQQAYKYEALEKMIRTEVIPHVGVDPAKKAVYLASLARMLLLTQLGARPTDDRDSSANVSRSRCSSPT
jgi:hypothetical protein